METANNKMKQKESFSEKKEMLFSGLYTHLTISFLVALFIVTLLYVLNRHTHFFKFLDIFPTSFEFVSVVVIPILTTLLIIYTYNLVHDPINPSPKKSELESAYELLLKRYSQKTLDEKSINLIYSREIVSNNGMTSMSKLVFLESFLIYVTKNDNDKDGALTKGITQIVDPLLEAERAEKPYPNVNDTERRILIEIEKSLDNGEFASIKSRIEDLSTIIVKNQNALNRANKINNLTIPVSFIGIGLTLFIWLYGMFSTSLSDKDVERISREVSSFVKDSIKTNNIIENTTTLDSLSVKQ